MAKECRIWDTAFEGFPALVLTNDQICLTVVPELGGKISSLVHVPSATEWLWRNPYLECREPVYGASYVREFDFGGVDECFPTVAPSFYPEEPWMGTRIPDHGEVWAQPWQVERIEESAARVVVRMSCYGVRLPYRFERVISLESGCPRVQLSYRATNLTPFAMPFIWSIHPLLQVTPGMRIQMPGCVDQVRVDFSTSDFLGKCGMVQPWPVVETASGDTLDLSVLQPRSLKQGVKYFTLPLRGAGLVEAAVVAPEGGRAFRFCFNTDEVTHIGVWMNCAGWTPIGKPPYYNLAFEPCIGASDSLTVATQHWREAGVLPSRGERCWSLSIELD